MSSATANGITIEYTEEGRGEPLLLVMGLGGQLVDWPQGFVDEIVGQGFRVIRFDNRDIGLSTEFTGRPPTTGQIVRAVLFRRPLAAEYQISDMATDAAGLLDALGIESAHVVGMSMGGMIGQAMAIDHRARVRSLTSVMSTTGNRKVGTPSPVLVRHGLRSKPPGRDEAVDAGVDFFRRISGPVFDDVEVRRMMQVSIERSYRPAGLARQAAAIFASPDRTPGLELLDLPTLVVHGLLDPLVRPSGGLATATAVRGSRLLMFNDMAHDLPSTRWAEIAEAIRRNADRAVSVGHAAT